MTLGFVMLAHNSLDRAAQVVEALSGLPTIVHVDQRANNDAFDRFAGKTSNLDNVTLAERLGIETVVDVALADGTRILCSLAEDRVFEPGQEIRLDFDPARAHLFASDTTAKAA